MSLGFREDRRRRRRKARWALFRWLFALVIVAVAGSIVFEVGYRRARTNEAAIAAEKTALQQRVDALVLETDALRAAVEGQRLQAEEWQKRWERDVPTGALKQLFDLVSERLDAGVSKERLSFVIAAATEERECDGDPATKRFVVRTPLYRGGQDAVRFADGAITVTGTGPSARDQEGRPEAWFDPAEEIDLRITHIGGETAEVSGALPLQHSLVVGNREYRFSVVAGQRGFVEVTSDTCRYP